MLRNTGQLEWPCRGCGVATLSSILPGLTIRMGTIEVWFAAVLAWTLSGQALAAHPSLRGRRQRRARVCDGCPGWASLKGLVFGPVAQLVRAHA